MIKISASTNPPKENELVEYVKKLQNYKVDYLHCDVMDGKFVEAKCLEFELLKEVCDNTLLPLDIHLMVADPLTELKRYMTLKPLYITLHYESFENKDDIIHAINFLKANKTLVGLSINPTTNVDEILPFITYIDLVLIMGVVPGKSGQKMISNTPRKVKQLRGIIYEHNYDVKIEVDGGITEENMEVLATNGADIIVMGKALYQATNRPELIKKVHKL